MISFMNSTAQIFATNVIAFSIFLIATFGTWRNASAEDYNLTGVEKIVLVSPQAVINVIPLAAGAQPTLRIYPNSAQSFSTRTDGTTLKVTGSGSKAAAAPRIDVYMNDVPVVIHLIEGQVNLTKSNNPITAEIQRGRIIGKDSKSAVTASILNGGMTLTNHQNRVNLDLYTGELTVKSMTGDLAAVVWKGEVSLEKVNGALNLKQHQGNVKTTAGVGSINFDIGRATAQFNDFKGRIDGLLQDGAVGMKLAPEPEVHVRSESGKVTVNAGDTSSFVSISTEDGELFPPPSLKVGKLKGSKVLKGRLKGAKAGGRIDVVAQAGQVYLRE